MDTTTELETGFKVESHIYKDTLEHMLNHHLERGWLLSKIFPETGASPNYYTCIWFKGVYDSSEHQISLQQESL